MKYLEVSSLPPSMGPLLDQNTTTVEFLQLRKIAKYKPLAGPSCLACVEYNKTSIFTICTEKHLQKVHRVDSVGKETAHADLFPEVFHGLFGGPFLVEVFKVQLEIVGGDGTVGGVEVSENVEGSGVGVAEDIVAKFINVGRRNCDEKELLE